MTEGRKNARRFSVCVRETDIQTEREREKKTESERNKNSIPLATKYPFYATAHGKKEIWIWQTEWKEEGNLGDGEKEKAFLSLRV